MKSLSLNNYILSFIKQKENDHLPVFHQHLRNTSAHRFYDRNRHRSLYPYHQRLLDGTPLQGGCQHDSLRTNSSRLERISHHKQPFFNVMPSFNCWSCLASVTLSCKT